MLVFRFDKGSFVLVYYFIQFRVNVFKIICVVFWKGSINNLESILLVVDYLNVIKVRYVDSNEVVYIVGVKYIVFDGQVRVVSNL